MRIPSKNYRKKGMIRWRCACRASAYTDLLPARICALPKCLLPKCPITKMSSYRNVPLRKCLLPKRPLSKCPLPKCLNTVSRRYKSSVNSGYPNFYGVLMAECFSLDCVVRVFISVRSDSLHRLVTVSCKTCLCFEL